MENSLKDTTTNILGEEFEGKGSSSSDDDAGSQQSDQEFFSQYESINLVLNEMDQTLDELKKCFDAIILDSTDTGNKTKMYSVLDRFKTQATRAKNKVKELEKYMKTCKTSDEQYNQIQQIRFYDVSQRLTALAGQFTSIQSAHQGRLKERIVKVYEIQGVEVTPDEVDQILESGETRLMDEVAETENKKRALREIDDRRQDILKLENAIRNLAELFTELSTLINEQGTMVNRIEHNYAETKAYVKTANEELTKAVTYKIAASKKKIIIISVVVGIIIIIIIIILASVFGK